MRRMTTEERAWAVGMIQAGRSIRMISILIQFKWFCISFCFIWIAVHLVPLSALIFICLTFTGRQASRKDTCSNCKAKPEVHCHRKCSRCTSKAEESRNNGTSRSSHQAKSFERSGIDGKPHSWCTWASHQWSDRQKSVARRWLEGPKALYWISSYNKASASPIGVGETPFAVYPCRLG